MIWRNLKTILYTIVPAESYYANHVCSGQNSWKKACFQFEHAFGSVHKALQISKIHSWVSSTGGHLSVSFHWYFRIAQSVRVSQMASKNGLTGNSSQAGAAYLTLSQIIKKDNSVVYFSVPQNTMTCGPYCFHFTDHSVCVFYFYLYLPVCLCGACITDWVHVGRPEILMETFRRCPPLVRWVRKNPFSCIFR